MIEPGDHESDLPVDDDVERNVKVARSSKPTLANDDASTTPKDGPVPVDSTVPGKRGRNLTADELRDELQSKLLGSAARKPPAKASEPSVHPADEKPATDIGSTNAAKRGRDLTAEELKRELQSKLIGNNSKAGTVATDKATPSKDNDNDVPSSTQKLSGADLRKQQQSHNGAPTDHVTARDVKLKLSEKNDRSIERRVVDEGTEREVHETLVRQVQVVESSEVVTEKVAGDGDGADEEVIEEEFEVCVDFD